MGFKRKFDSEDSSAVAPDPDSFRMAKQLKQVPFPHSYQDEDSAMSEATPLYPDQAHSRFHSNASTSSTSSIDPSPSATYPTFQLYGTATPQDTAPTSTRPVGLMQPTSAFAHHGTGCTTIPRLRVACSTSIHGERRSMYTLCESCGAISMVDCD